MPRVKRVSKPIPSIGSRTGTFEANDYSKGFNTYISNDKFPMNNGGANAWRLAQDARISTLGEYETRKGFDFHSDAAGETQDQAIADTTGAADQPFNAVDRLAQKFTAVDAGRLTKVTLNLKKNSATGVIKVEIWSDSSGPSALLSSTSIDGTTLLDTYSYITARFPEPATITATDSFWIVVYVQAGGSGSYHISSTTVATTAMTSSDGGTVWAAAAFALNFTELCSTDGAVKGLHRAYKSDGTKVTLFVQGTVLYSVDNVTGALTEVKTGLNASATRYRFVTVNDIVYYVNSYDGLRKWDFTTESQVNATNYSHICEHKGMLFLVDAADPNKIVFSNFAAYETFTSTDFIYAPSPKTGDPVTALVPLNGYLIIFTLNNKFVLSGSDNATYALDEAPDQKGTYTQETTTTDSNYVYYLSDDGVYRSNGSEGQLLSENIHTDIIELQNKDDACVVVNRARLYVWFKSNGVSANDSCYVWNLNYGSGGADTVESTDTEAFVTRATNAFRDSDDLLVASSLVGQVYWQEKVSNDYSNLGGDINYDLKSHYMTYDNPTALKELRNWYARFGAQAGDYQVTCAYATDLRDNWTTQLSPNIQGQGYEWGDAGTVWGAFTWGTTAEVQTSDYVPGEFRRVAIRYYHHAARQPQKFLGHTLKVQTRRMR